MRTLQASCLHCPWEPISCANAHRRARRVPLTRHGTLMRIFAGSGLTHWRAAHYHSSSSNSIRSAPDGSVFLDNVTGASGSNEAEGPAPSQHSPWPSSEISASLVETRQSVSIAVRQQTKAQSARSEREIVCYVPGVIVETDGIQPKGDDRVLLRALA